MCYAVNERVPRNNVVKMTDLLAGIRFVSKADLDERKRLAKEAEQRREVEAKEAAKERRQAAVASVTSGQSKWLAPALERRLGGTGASGAEKDDERERKRKKKEKHHKSDKDKHKHTSERKHKHKHKHDKSEGPDAPAGSDESPSSDDDAAGELAKVPAEVAPSAAAGRAPVAGDAARSAAGLNWMERDWMRPPTAADGAKSIAAAAAAALDLRAPTKAAEGLADAASSAAPSARISRELNPYARDGTEIDQWTARALGRQEEAPVAAVRAAGTDGGTSWQQKKLKRAVEEARETGRSLTEICMERWGDLTNLEQLEAISRAPAERAGKGGVGQGAAFDALASGDERHGEGRGGVAQGGGDAWGLKR